MDNPIPALNCSCLFKFVREQCCSAAFTLQEMYGDVCLSYYDLITCDTLN